MKSYTQFERRKYILDELEKYNRVMVNDLAKALNVTTETIRRDLDMMHKEGKLTKIHGGAVKKKIILLNFILTNVDLRILKKNEKLLWKQVN